LRDEWLELCAGYGLADDPARRAFDRLVEAYAGPGRAYHTLEHIGHVLQTLTAVRDQSRDFTALRFAAWFHDAIYDARAKDNEERSADLAATVLGELNIAAETAAEVRRLILLTKTHDPSPDDPDGRLLVDADLAILGASAEEYRCYAAAIRREYDWVPDEAYRAGRRAVLEGFLRRPRLFRTVVLAAREEQARRNLAAEIESLRTS
jgi:predicted metal-dependent HD superfamily phosphohydrolase